MSQEEVTLSLAEAASYVDKLSLLQDLLTFMDGLQYDGEGQESAWIDGHSAGLSSVDWWVKEKMAELVKDVGQDVAQKLRGQS